MGCDIHVYLAKKISKGLAVVKTIDTGGYENEAEATFLSPHVSRNYELFGMLSGVRGEAEIVESSCEGFPGGLSDEFLHSVDFLYTGGDRHSHTHIWLDDLEEEHRRVKVFQKRFSYAGDGKINKWYPLKDFYETMKKLSDRVLPGVAAGDIVVLFCYNN